MKVRANLQAILVPRAWLVHAFDRQAAPMAAKTGIEEEHAVPIERARVSAAYPSSMPARSAAFNTASRKAWLF